MAGKMIKLKSSGPRAKVIEVEVEVAMKSKMIKQKVLEDFRTAEPIPLLEVDAVTLKKVIEWSTHHKNDSELTDEEEKKKINWWLDEISPWDAEFLKVDQRALFDLIMAAKYLDIKGLLDVTCHTLANIIKDMTPDQIRQTYNIENDLTPAEEEQIRQENEFYELLVQQ